MNTLMSYDTLKLREVNIISKSKQAQYYVRQQLNDKINFNVTGK